MRPLLPSLLSSSSATSPPSFVLIVRVCLGGMCLGNVAWRHRRRRRRRRGNKVHNQEGEDCQRGRHSTAERHGEAAQSIHKCLRLRGACVLPVTPRMFPGPNPSLAVRQKAIRDIRSRPAGGFDCRPQSIPCNLLASLHALMWRLLNVIAGLDRSNTPFCYSGHDLSLLVLLAATEVAALYYSVDNASAPFFSHGRWTDAC